MNKKNQDLMNELQGKEIFFKEFGVVGIEGNNLVRGGEVVFKVKDSNIDELISEVNMTEYGTDDFSKIAEMEGF